jgi:dihydrofolate reductase
MIRLIAAIDNHNGIAKDGVQPWKLPTDEKYFLDQTKRFGGNILRGRKEYEVFNRPIPDHHNFVLSHKAGADDRVTWVTDLDAFLRDFTEDLWVVGGANVYEQTIALAQELYITEINKDYDCDKFFPHFSADFHLQGPRTEIKENGTSYWFCVYVRNAPATPDLRYIL